jgi:hypothetical protein
MKKIEKKEEAEITLTHVTFGVALNKNGKFELLQFDYNLSGDTKMTLLKEFEHKDDAIEAFKIETAYKVFIY